MITAENALLRVRRVRQSRNGPFSVADLYTDFGEFKVKDPLLEQFEEGEYQVTAWISYIFLRQYVAYGKGVSELRVQLDDLQVHTEDQKPTPREPVELDPMDEPEPVIMTRQAAPSEPQQTLTAATKDSRWDKFKKPVKSKGARQTSPTAEEADDQLDDIYDEAMQAAIKQRAPVTVDVSVDRALLRKQVEGLKERGYRYDSIQKLWIVN